MIVNNFIRIFGYSVSIVVLIVGIVITAGFLMPGNIPNNFRILLGIVFILYGIFRFVALWTSRKKIENIDGN